MNKKILQYLVTLYGRDVAVTVWGKLAELMAPRARGSERGGAFQFSEGDALLITYADQVTEPERAPLRTLAEFCQAHLHNVVSGVHLLPFYPWSSDDGFSVKDFVAVEPSYGSWADVARFRPGFDLMFDAVFNHMSAQSEWFQSFLKGADAAFRDFFVTVEGEPDLSQVVRPRALPLLTEFQSGNNFKKVWTTFSADQVDLNFKNPEVLLATIRVLLFYVQQGARFIRLDAIAYLWKEIGTTCIHLPQAHAVIQLYRAVLDEVAPEVMLITETNVPHHDNITYFGDGTNEAQLVYNFSLPPLALHSLLTGDAAVLTRWAQSLSLPSSRVTWFNFLASHDGIGVNPARGILTEAEIAALTERVVAHGGFISYKSMPDGSQVPYEMNINYLDAISDPAANEPVEIASRKFLTVQAIMLSMQGVPGIYFHSLFGSRGDCAAVGKTGIKRRINREKLSYARLNRELADPGSLRAHVFTGFRELLSKRRVHSAFAPLAPQRILDLDPRVFAVLRESRDGTDRVLCLHNVSPQTVEVQAGKAGFESCVLAGHESRWLPA